MSRFGLDVDQANAILEMQLRRLTGLEQDKVKAEYDELLKKIAEYESILASRQKILDIIKAELLEDKEKYGDDRKTQILPEQGEVTIEDLTPNTPMAVREGMCLLEQTHSLTDEEFSAIKDAFSSVGEIEVVPNHLMGVGGALSGCAPAYIYMVIEALADGAVMQGMPRKMAYKLASQTVLGSGKMQLKTDLHPGILKDNVTSPGGSTIRGVKALEDAGMRSAFINAIEKSMNK